MAGGPGCCRRCIACSCGWCCCCCFGACKLAAAGFVLALALAIGPPPGRLDGETAEICETSMWFKDHMMSYTDATDRNVEAYMEACREVFPKLDPEVRSTLQRLREEGTLRSPTALLDEEVSAADTWNAAEAVKWLQRENSSGSNTTSPVRDVDISEVFGALQRAEVVRFDAAPLLLPGMLNATLPELERLHSDASADIIAYGSFDAGAICYFLISWVLTYAYPRVGRSTLFWAMRQVAVRFSRATCFRRSLAEYARSAETLRKAGPTNINARRLPRFAVGADFAGRLGFGELVERTESWLWFGFNPNPLASYHTDVQDNVLVELTGGSEVSIFPPGAFDALLNGSADHPVHYRVTVRPGQGVVIPSNFLHAVWHLQSNRTAYNAFFEPRFGEMQWPEAKGNMYTKWGQRRKGYLCMRNLWLRSLGHLWDTQQIGMAMHGWKMEFL